MREYVYLSEQGDDKYSDLGDNRCSDSSPGH